MLYIHNPMANCAIAQTGIVKGIIASNRSTLMYRACKSRARKRGWGTWGQEVYIIHINIWDFVLCLVVIIELFRNSVIQLYCPKDYYKQKQWNTLPVTMITEIMNFNRLLWWLPWQVLACGDLD